jgi:rubrerythrin
MSINNSNNNDMKEFSNINDILDFAITAEQGAVDFYNGLAKQATHEDMRKTFAQFAQEEMGHKARLTQIKETGLLSLTGEQVADLKISNYIPAVQATPGMTYSEALVLAMSREKAAFKLYMALSERVGKEDMKQLFLGLAMEESKHKLRFELEYDEYVLKEN